MNLEELLNRLHALGGGLHTLPSGSVTAFIRMPGNCWRTKTIRPSHVETIAQASIRAISGLIEETIVNPSKPNA